MPLVSLVHLAGFRVREEELAELGMRLPSLSKRGAAIGSLPGLGALTLSGAAPENWQARYHAPERIDEDFVERLFAEGPDLVAVSALTASALEAYRLSAAVRSRGLPVVIGGLHASVLPSEAANHADAVVVGEGEDVWPAVLRDAESGRLAPRYQARRPFDLANAPIPRFELLGARRPARFTLQTQRGCPLACEFCGASRLLGPFREKPVHRIADELEALRVLDPEPMLELADDNTFAGRRDVRPLLDVLRSSGARWFTEVDWRVGERPELVSVLSESGCVQVLVGIESLTSRFAGMGAKAADRSRVLDSVERIQEHGVAVLACFVVGGDADDRRALDELALFLEDAPFADVQLTVLTPFPGTVLHERLQREGRLLERDWSHYTLFDVTFRPQRMGVEELEAAFRDLVATAHRPEAARRRAEIRRRIWRNRMHEEHASELSLESER